MASPSKNIIHSVPNQPNKFEKNSDSHVCVIGNPSIMLQFSNGLAKMYGYTNKFVKLVHAVKFPTDQLVRAAHLTNTTDVLLLLKNEPHSLSRFNIEDSSCRNLDLRDRFGVEEPILDFILPSKLYQEQIMILTKSSTYLLTLRGEQGRGGTSESLIRIAYDNRFERLYHHSLNGYLAVCENGDYHLYKTLTAINPLFRHRMPFAASCIGYSSNYILYALGRIVEMIVLDKKNMKYLDTVVMELDQVEL